ncbi:MAG: lysophospholipid acyltransferase family protein [Dehalococcoidia bacterium]
MKNTSIRPLVESGFYWLMTRATATVVWTFGRWRVSGAERVPASGPLIVVSNHLNNADPPLLGASVPRRIHFMAKHELFAVPVGGFFIQLFGAFPVRRFEADLKALRAAQRLLADGEVIGMFPEGHRSQGAGMIRAHPGTALLALRSGAPVLPVAITGSELIRGPRVLLQRPRISVTIGEPFLLKADGRLTSERVASASEEIMIHIAAMLPIRYRGVYSEERNDSRGRQ